MNNTTVDVETLTSRAAVITLARANGVRAPATDRIASVAELDRWIAVNGLPAMLKSDRSCGGLGVVLVRGRTEAKRHFAKLAAPPGAAYAIKRAIIDRDCQPLRAWWLRQRSTVNIQHFVGGRDGNIAVACWNGDILASIAAEVLEVNYANGPASVLRVIDHPEMDETARIVVSQLGLSGLCGLDFILDAHGAAHLIELNARATPTCHLPLGPGRDLPWVLRTCFGGDFRRTAEQVTENPVIALHPSARSDQISKWNAWLDEPS